MPDQSEPSALSFETTEDLLVELLHRFDHGVFVGLSVISDDGNFRVRQRWHGNAYTCSGLVNAVSLAIIEGHNEECMDPKDDDAPE